MLRGERSGLTGIAVGLFRGDEAPALGFCTSIDGESDSFLLDAEFRLTVVEDQ